MFHILVLVVSASAIDCLERLISKMTLMSVPVSSGMLNPTHSLQACIKRG